MSTATISKPVPSDVNEDVGVCFATGLLLGAPLVIGAALGVVSLCGTDASTGVLRGPLTGVPRGEAMGTGTATGALGGATVTKLTSLST